jgi:tRNA(fMet)-specific endonuclease VapC
MISHLLDTNIVSYLMKARPQRVMDNLHALGPDRVAISVITAIELRQGAELHADSARYHAAIDTLLNEIPTLPLPIEVADIGGKLRAKLQKTGTGFGDLDSLIAAHALAADLTLVTNDGGFQRIEGLRLEKWT